MSTKQKRSSGGGYGLRRKSTKKKWDDDFEYNFSKTKLGSKAPKDIQETRVKSAQGVDSKIEVNRSESDGSVKRHRGRPRKNHEVIEQQVRREEEIPLKKRGRRPDNNDMRKVIKIQEVNEEEEPNAAELVEELKRLEDRRRKIEETKKLKLQAMRKQRYKREVKHGREDVQEKPKEETKNPKLESKKRGVKVEAIEKQKHHEMKEKNSEEISPKIDAPQVTVYSRVNIECDKDNVSQEYEVSTEQPVNKYFKIEKTEGKENKPQHEIERDDIIVQGVESDDENVILNMSVEEDETVGMEEVTIQDPSHTSDTTCKKKAHKKLKRERQSPLHFQKIGEYSGEDKIECEECHKLLKPSSFRQHLRTHTGVKPFECQVCKARFTRKGDVERHVRIVHQKHKPFKCCRCQRAFGDKKNLRWHLMNHDKKLFYICEVCGFKFGKREYWENHVRFIHPMSLAVESYLPEGSVTVIQTKDGERCEETFGSFTESLLATAVEESVDDPAAYVVSSEGRRTIDAVQELVRAEQAENNLKDKQSVNSEIRLKAVSSSQPSILINEDERTNLSHKSAIKIHATELSQESNSANQVAGKADQRPVIQQVMSVNNISVSDIVRLAQASQNRMSNIHSCTEVRQQDGIEAVVIHLDESNPSDGSQISKDSPQVHTFPPNLLHVVTTDDDHIVQDNIEGPEQIVVESPDYFNTSVEVAQDTVSETEGMTDTGGSGDGMYQVEETPHIDASPRVISIVVKEEQHGVEGNGGDDGNNTVQTLIEALLDAAKDDNQRAKTSDDVTYDVENCSSAEAQNS